MTTTNPPTVLRRRATLGAVGGALWALSPTAWLIADIRALEAWTSPFSAALITFVLVMVVGPALVVVGHTALQAVLGAAGGRSGTAGIVIAGVGLTAVAVGNGVELASLGAGAGTSVVGYVVFYVGFLVSLLGSLLVGITVIRRRWDDASRIAGWVLALALPLGIGVGLLAALVVPGNEAGFSAAVALPTGVAWALLGRSLARRRSAATEGTAAAVVG